MKTKFIFCTLFLLTLSGCLGKNSLEKSMDLFSPTARTDAASWADSGGLKSSSSFYGLTIDGVTYSHRSKAGTLANAQFLVAPTASPADMRKALSKACQIPEDGFTRISNQRGEGKNGAITCYYESGAQNHMVILDGKGN
jgi:hypothetical protein